MNQNIIYQLRAPFSFEEIETKIQVTSENKQMGMVVFYLNGRAVQKRLDAVLGPFGWSNTYIPCQNNAQICSISLYNQERNEWVVKSDGADNSAVEPIKGGLTDAFKRAAVLWGIGRYLYEIGGVWVEIEPKGKSHAIKASQQNKLKTAYEAAVKRIFETVAQQFTTPTGSQNESGQQSSALNNSNEKQTHNKDNIPEYDYTVHSMKPSGNSHLLELYSLGGEIISAYIRAGEHGINVGANLKGVKLEQKTGVQGLYNILSEYSIAA